MAEIPISDAEREAARSAFLANYTNPLDGPPLNAALDAFAGVRDRLVAAQALRDAAAAIEAMGEGWGWLYRRADELERGTPPTEGTVSDGHGNTVERCGKPGCPVKFDRPGVPSCTCWGDNTYRIVSGEGVQR